MDLDQSSPTYTRRVKCPDCAAAIPVLEVDANGYVECFCGGHAAAGPRAHLLNARRSLQVARHNDELRSA